MIRLLEDLLSKQDQTKPHTLLTRLVVTFCVSFAVIVLYGFYGLVAATAFFLIGVGFMDLPLLWMFYPIALGLLVGGWKAFWHLRDYWVNYGHGEQASE